jgi:hypothetical protein
METMTIVSVNLFKSLTFQEWGGGVLAVLKQLTIKYDEKSF